MTNLLQNNFIFALFIYIILTLIFGILGQKKVHKSNFLSNYYLGGRNLGFMALSMSIFASYVSSGTFLAGFGASYLYGFAWLWIGVIQAISIVFIFYVVRSKLKDLSSKYNIITVPELFHKYYQSKSLALVGALAIICFMPFILMAQWQGGSYLLTNILNIEYKNALILFSLFVGTYTIMGGFKWVVSTDILQGILMFFGSILIYYGIVSSSSGLAEISNTLQNLGQSFFESQGYQNKLSAPSILSFWFLVGIGLLGLPHIILRFMAFKDDASFNKSIILTPIMITILMLVLNLSGIYSRVILPNFTGNPDTLLMEVLPIIFNDFVTIFIIIAILSSIISTSDSILLVIISAINYDIIHKNFIYKKNININYAFFNKLIGIIIVFIIAATTTFMQQNILYLNFLGFGAVQSAFFIPICAIIFGSKKKPSFYKKIILYNVILTTLLYCILFILKPTILFGFHPVVFSLTFSIILHFILLFIYSKQRNYYAT